MAGFRPDWTLSTNASVLESRMLNGINEGNRIPGQARYVVNINVAKPPRRTGGWFGGASIFLSGSADLNGSPDITVVQSARAAGDSF